MDIKIERRRLAGDLQAPPSKSFAHRQMIAAALAAGRSVIRGVSESEDMLATLDCIAALGATYELNGDILTVDGIGKKLLRSASVLEKALYGGENCTHACGGGASLSENGALLCEKSETGCKKSRTGCKNSTEMGQNPASACKKDEESIQKAAPVCEKIEENTKKEIPVCGDLSEHACVFRCRESGSTLRFFIPVALLLGTRVRFEGTPRLMERGIGVYEELFCEKGITVEKTATSITLAGRLTAGTYTLRGDVSSQFITGLLFALPLLDGESTVKVLPPVESRGYIDMTLQVLATFGVEVKEVASNTFLIKGSGYQPRNIEVEGDWSNGAALLALRALGHDVRVAGLDTGSLQGDRVCLDIFAKLKAPLPSTALISKKEVRTTFLADAPLDFPASAPAVDEIDLSNCPDLAPVMFAVAAVRGSAVFTGTRRLRMKESDRAAVMAEELAKFGVSVEVEENRVTVHGGAFVSPAVVCESHNDHRVVMALTLLGLLVGCEIRGAEAVAKSFPHFFSELGLS